MPVIGLEHLQYKHFRLLYVFSKVYIFYIIFDLVFEKIFFYTVENDLMCAVGVLMTPIPLSV
jgi:hypothetical protein